jgi:hypothetical protein
MLVHGVLVHGMLAPAGLLRQNVCGTQSLADDGVQETASGR